MNRKSNAFILASILVFTTILGNENMKQWHAKSKKHISCSVYIRWYDPACSKNAINLHFYHKNYFSLFMTFGCILSKLLTWNLTKGTDHLLSEAIYNWHVKMFFIVCKFFGCKWAHIDFRQNQVFLDFLDDVYLQINIHQYTWLDVQAQN